MGSMKRKTKKSVAKHLRLIKGGKPAPKPLPGCPECRDDYELEHVTCCVSCHRRGDFSEVTDSEGRFMVCCSIRQALCPSEDAPRHPGAA